MCSKNRGRDKNSNVGFHQWTTCLFFILTFDFDFGRNLRKQHRAKRLATGRCRMANVVPSNSKRLELKCLGKWRRIGLVCSKCDRRNVGPITFQVLPNLCKHLLLVSPITAKDSGNVLSIVFNFPPLLFDPTTPSTRRDT